MIQRLVVGSRSYAQAMEMAAISAFHTRSRRFGYNVAKGGDISPMHSSAVAAKVAATKRGKQLSDATHAGWQAWIADNRDTHGQKLREIHKARWTAMSAEERRIHLESRGFVPGKKPHNKGQKITDPVILANIRAAAANRGPEWLAKVTAGNQQQEFTAAKAAQLAAARQNVDHAARTAKTVIGNRANWADPEKRKVRIAKLKATWAAKRQ